MDNFKEITQMKFWCQKVLPLVYDDSLSYLEVLCKVTNKLNDLIENNAKIPDFIADLIREYISSGAIEKVLADVLANFMLNVKFPPAGLTPATGDGSKDDTQAIQGCIDYAFNHGGMAIYFPSGKYLTQPLILRSKVSLFGQDRYTTQLVLRGGATTAMFTGVVDDISLTGLGFDGNMDIQVNNVNLFDFTSNSALISNVLLNDGYKLLNVTVNKDLQINNVIFDHAVETGMVVRGNGYVQGNNLIFNSVSSSTGKNFIELGTNKSTLSDVKCFGLSPNCVLITGNNNVVKFWDEQSIKSYIDNGENNNILVYGKEEITSLSGNLKESIGGTLTETITGDKNVNANNLLEALNGNKTVTVGGNETVNIEGKSTQTINGDLELLSKNIVATVNTNVGITADEIILTAFKDMKHDADNINLTANNAINLTGQDVAIKSVNPVTYKTPVDTVSPLFKAVPAKDINGDLYNLLVEGDLSKLNDFIKNSIYSNFEVEQFVSGNTLNLFTTNVTIVKVPSTFKLKVGVVDPTFQKTKNVVDYSYSVNANVCINAGTFNMSTNEPRGIVLQNGSIIHDAKFTSGETTPAGLLCINDQGVMSSMLSADLTANQVLSQGIKNAVQGWYPLLENNVVKFIGTPTCNGRTVIGQDSMGNYFLLVAPSNSQNIGLDENKCIQLLRDRGCIFAYSLDGGGSSSIAYKNIPMCPVNYEGTFRPIITTLYFDSLQPTSSLSDAFYQVGLSKLYEMMSIYSKDYVNSITMKVYNPGANNGGIDIYDGYDRITKGNRTLKMGTSSDSTYGKQVSFALRDDTGEFTAFKANRGGLADFNDNLGKFYANPFSDFNWSTSLSGCYFHANNSFLPALPSGEYYMFMIRRYASGPAVSYIVNRAGTDPNMYIDYYNGSTHKTYKNTLTVL